MAHAARLLPFAGRKLASGRYEMFGLTQDVTELAQARDNADLISGRLELAMAAAKAGVYEIDLKTGDRWSSEQFRTLAGPEAMARQALNPFGVYAEDQQVPRFASQLGALPCLQRRREHGHAHLTRRTARAAGCACSPASSATPPARMCALSA
jgi:hypothetical protein